MHTQVQFLCLYLVCLLTVSGQPGKKRDLIAPIHNVKRRTSSGCFSGSWGPLWGPPDSFYFPLPACPPSRQGHLTECETFFIPLITRLYLMKFNFPSRNLTSLLTQELPLPSALSKGNFDWFWFHLWHLLFSCAELCARTNSEFSHRRFDHIDSWAQFRCSHWTYWSGHGSWTGSCSLFALPVTGRLNHPECTSGERLNLP